MQLTFTQFKSHVLSTKHNVWFDYHVERKQRQIWREWLNRSKILSDDGKSPSLRKYIYNARNDYRFTVPKQELRKNILKDILQ
jgi:hypothetical protein